MALEGDILYRGRTMTVRPLHDRDFDQLKCLVNDTDTMAHLLHYFGRTIWTDAEVRERLEKLRQLNRDGKRLTLVAADPETDLLWGHFDFQRLGDEPGVGEFGIILHKRLWGSGAAAEAFLFGLDYGFSRMGLTRVWAQTDKGNMKMRSFFERIGFHPLGEMDAAHVGYDLAAVDWPACQERLQLRLAGQAL